MAKVRARRREAGRKREKKRRQVGREGMRRVGVRRVDERVCSRAVVGWFWVMVATCSARQGIWGVMVAYGTGADVGLEGTRLALRKADPT